MDKRTWSEALEQRSNRIFEQRKAKIPLLAKHFGIEFEHLDLSDHSDLVAFYGHLAITLAIEIVPGFQEAKPAKWDLSLVMWILVHCEKQKQTGQAKNDFAVCLEAVKDLDPNMTKPSNRLVTKGRALQLRNRVAKLRAKLKREHRSNASRGASHSRLH